MFVCCCVPVLARRALRVFCLVPLSLAPQDQTDTRAWCSVVRSWCSLLSGCACALVRGGPAGAAFGVVLLCLSELGGFGFGFLQASRTL